MADILRVKRSLNVSQRKMSSRLVFAALEARHQLIPLVPLTQLEAARSGSPGTVTVDVKVNNMEGALRQVTAAGGSVLSSSDKNRILRARLPLLNLETLAAGVAVRSVAPPARPRLLGARPPYASAQLLLHPRMAPFVGSITSQGYITHGAKAALNLGFDGSGVRVGILSDSASDASISNLIETGDLPGDVVVVPGQAGPADGSNEGTAIMEIVHDLAPGAKLYFATAFDSESSFADNIRTLRYTYGCDVILDDVQYSDEGVFQDSLVAAAVNEVTTDGALYFASAGNAGNLTSGSSSVYEGDFQDGGDAGSLVDLFEGSPVTANNFGAATPQGFDPLLSTSNDISLTWSDPLGASSNDYDLFVLNSTGTRVLDYSVNIQSGSQDPVESVSSSIGYPAGSQVVVVRFGAEPRALHLDSGGAGFSIATSGAITGHNAAASTVSIAASAWNSSRHGLKLFSAANPVEPFSSDGPRRIFYMPDGTPITDGNFLLGTNGGQSVPKPDLTAADGVFCKTPGFLPFYGTSAAVPHAAAIAALVKSANPALTNKQIRSILTSTTADNMAPGFDRDSGFGIVLALPSVQAALSY